MCVGGLIFVAALHISPNSYMKGNRPMVCGHSSTSLSSQCCVCCEMSRGLMIDFVRQRFGTHHLGSGLSFGTVALALQIGIQELRQDDLRKTTQGARPTLFLDFELWAVNVCEYRNVSVGLVACNHYLSDSLISPATTSLLNLCHESSRLGLQRI